MLEIIDVLYSTKACSVSGWLYIESRPSAAGKTLLSSGIPGGSGVRKPAQQPPPAVSY